MYQLVDIELTSALSPVALESGENGIGIVARVHGWPVALVFEAVEGGTTLSAIDVDRLIGRTAGLNVIRRAIRDELSVDQPDATDSTSPRDSTEARSSTRCPPSISVAICTRDRTDRLADCLRSLAVARRAEAGEPVEVLVVDNDPSDDATRSLVDTYPDVSYVLELKAGLDFARNRALATATGEVLAFLDDDVAVDPKWLTGLRAAWTEHPDAGCVTGLVLPFELASEAQVRFERRGGFGRGFHQIRWQGFSDPGNPLYPYGSGVFGAGCNMSFRRALVEELGGFDEALDTGPPLPGGGDIDMFFRVAQAGEPVIYEPRAAVRHKHRREHEALRRQYRSWGTGFMAFLVKWYPQVSADERAKIRRLVRWWFRYEAKLLANGVLGRRGMTVDLALAELVGGVVGLAGEYGRSQRRVDRIRARMSA